MVGRSIRWRRCWRDFHWRSRNSTRCGCGCSWWSHSFGWWLY